MRANNGDIWEWTPTSGGLIEYWLITEAPSKALCIFGESYGDVDEITVNDHYYLRNWKKVA
jgi:hypothetical protein